ncbi:MAG: hypothetical protein GY758_31110 [Fuerstiella sp.]|nr:hypothetical protein [Fuerstiella sp.]MCP4508525.1 hypothetical protein [Fuerstiella sp.]
MSGLKIAFAFFAAPTSGVFLSFSRSLIICAGGVVAIVAALRHISRVKISAAVVLVLVALIMTPRYPGSLTTLVNLRALSSPGEHSSADGALKGRATETGGTACVFFDHPVVEAGHGQFKDYSREYGERIGLRAVAPNRQTHCLPLDVAAENRFIALMCLLAIFWTQGTQLLGQIDDDTAGKTDPLRRVSARAFKMLAVYSVTGLTLPFACILNFRRMMAGGDAAVCIGRQQAEAQPAVSMSSFAGHIS